MDDKELKQDTDCDETDNASESILKMEECDEKTLKLIDICIEMNQKLIADENFVRRSREDVSDCLRHWSTFRYGPNIYSSLNAGCVSRGSISKEARIVYVQTKAYVIHNKCNS